MFLVVLRVLLIIALIAGLGYAYYKYQKKICLTENRKEDLEEAKTIIDETLKEADKLPQVDSGKLKSAKEKIDNFLKEGKGVE